MNGRPSKTLSSMIVILRHRVVPSVELVSKIRFKSSLEGLTKSTPGSKNRQIKCYHIASYTFVSKQLRLLVINCNVICLHIMY